MLRALLAFRFIMIVAALGAALGALVMLWEGCIKLFAALRGVLRTGDEAGAAIGLVMGATDAFLFAVVLVIFAYAIVFGFVIELAPDERERLPAWMRVAGVGELKETLVGVIIVYLIVDFATDVAEAPRHLEWRMLVMPVAILLIAAALRLLSAAHGGRERP